MSRKDQDAAVRAAAGRYRALAAKLEHTTTLHSIDQALALGELIDESDAIRSDIDSAREVAYALSTPGAA